MTLDLIINQIGSTGEKGWPVAVSDRISYPKDKNISDANVAVTFLWTIRDEVLPFLEKTNLALASNFYTPAGLEGMIRNILSNPFIRYVILLGNEHSSKSKNLNELTSANAIRVFFQKGVDGNRKLPGFENAVSFDKNIPINMIDKVRENVELIDLNKKMPDFSLKEKIEKANELIKTLEKKGPFLDKPLTFEYEKTVDSFPYEGGPLVVNGSSIPLTWIEIMHNIYRHGVDNLMDANTDRWVKEINNLVAVIHDPQNMDLSVNPFLVPLTVEKIEAYQKEILSHKLPEGKAYTYGNKLRAYKIENPEYIKNIVKSTGFKDFEFGQGPHVDKNVKYLDKFCEINQIADIIDALKRNLYGKWGVGITWHPADELMRKHKSSPCLIFLQALVQNEKLNLTVYFRSHDMVQGWPENAYGCAAIQKEIADGIGVESGKLTIISCSAQIYKHYYVQVEEMLKKHRKYEISYNDPRGNFLVDVKDGKIVVIHIHPKTNKELEKFEGSTAIELIKKISEKASINTAHALDLGAELQKAEICLKKGLKYEQDKELAL